MNDQARACAAYFQSRPGYRRILSELLKKYRSIRPASRNPSGWTTQPKRSAMPLGAFLAVLSPRRCGSMRRSLRRPFRNSVLGKSL